MAIPRKSQAAGGKDPPRPAADSPANVIFREVTQADGRGISRYEILGAACFDPGACRSELALCVSSADPAQVAFLVIREWLDADGALLACVIERRLGSPDGPFHGRPARVEFDGAVECVRSFQARPDGGLVEAFPGIHGRTAQPAVLDEAFAGEQRAACARFGETTRVAATREPTTLEDSAGFSTVLRLVLPDGQVVCCGVIWMGTEAVLIQGRFPWHDDPPHLTPAGFARLREAAAAYGLRPHELRHDRDGFALLAHRPGSMLMHLLRVAGTEVRVELYHPLSHLAALNPDQVKWLRYVERYEDLVVIDIFPERDPGHAGALTVDRRRRLLRHRIDPDGVEGIRTILPRLPSFRPAGTQD